MIYVVRRLDKSPAFDDYILMYVGYTDNKHIAEEYLNFRLHKVRKDSSVTFDVIMLSESKFYEFREVDNKLAVCPEITKIVKDIYLSDDDYEFIESVMNEKVTEMNYHIREVIETLKFFKNADCEKTVKMLKKVKNLFEYDHDGEEVWADMDWDRCTKKIIL